MKKIIGFSASWCPNCPRMKPVWEKLAEEYEVQVIDVDENREVAEAYGIKSIPASVILEDGKDIKLIVGAKPYSFIKDKLKD